VLFNVISVYYFSSMNTEFKKYFNFARSFETQKIGNDYKHTKHYKISTYNSLIIFGFLGMFIVKYTISFFKNKEVYQKSISYRKRMFRRIIFFE